MKKTFLLIIILVVSLCTSCIDEDEYDNSPQGNFEALWKILDEHYCFFDYKQSEFGLDWNTVYEKYKVRAQEDITDAQLFEVLSDMLAELCDGHVNLSYSADFSRYWGWYENHPANFSDSLNRRYLGTDYKKAAGLKYRVLNDNIGYIYYESFSDGVGDGNIDDVLNYLITCRGLIIDIRNNSGGNLTNAERLAARFFNAPTLVGYMQHKTGAGHNDFSSMEEQWITPSRNLRWHKKVCVLTNRKVFSAANEFVKYMKCAPQALIVGDQTGGGAGLPFSSMLPNGWYVRFSACPMYDRNGQSTEHGISPDYDIPLKEEDVAKGKDTIIEYARRLLSK